MPVLDSPPAPHFRVLLYGPTGAGKSYLAASSVLVEAMCPVILFDVEAGVDRIRFSDNRSIWNFVKEGKLTVVSTVSGADLGLLQRALTTPGRYKTIIVDSLTELHALILRLILQQRSGAGVTLQDYGTVSGKVLEALRLAQLCPANFIATCGHMYSKDEIYGTLHIEPDITGKLAQRSPRFFDIVGYLTANIRRAPIQQVQQAQGKPEEMVPTKAADVQRTLQVQPYSRIAAKDRSGNLGASLPDPMMSNMYAIYFGAEASKPIELPFASEGIEVRPEPELEPEATTT